MPMRTRCRRRTGAGSATCSRERDTLAGRFQQPNSSHYLVPVNLITGSNKLFREPRLPSAFFIIRRPKHSAKVTGYLDIASLQRAYSLSAKRANKVSEFQQDILSRTWPERLALLGPFIVWREKHYGKSYLTVRFNLLDDGSILVRLLAQHYRLEAYLVEKVRDGFARSLIVTMDNKDPSRVLYGFGADFFIFNENRLAKLGKVFVQRAHCFVQEG
jgi:hypothetical protein